MPDDTDNLPGAEAGAPEGAEGAAAAASMDVPVIPVRAAEMNWSQVWQLPVLLLGLGMLVLGVYLAIDEKEFPDFTKNLDQVATLNEAGRLEEAFEQLEALRENETFQAMPKQPEIHGRFFELRADWRFLDLHMQAYVDLTTVSAMDASGTIIEEYGQAELLGRELSAGAMRRYAETLTVLGRDREAVALIEGLPDSAYRQKYQVLRSLIERRMAMPPEQQDEEDLAELFGRFAEAVRLEPDQRLRLQQEVWLSYTKADRYLEAGAPQRAVDLLRRDVLRLTSKTSDPSRPVEIKRLLVLMGDAMFALEENEQAELFYRQADVLLRDSEPLKSRVLVGLGQLAMSRGGHADPNRREQAMSFFLDATRHFPTSESYISALIGLGEAYAWDPAESQVPEALRVFDLAVGELIGKTPPWDPRRAQLREVVQAQTKRAIDRGNFKQALSMLTVLRPMDEPDLPPDVLRGFATVHELIGKQSLSQAEKFDPDRTGDSSNYQAFKMANQEAAFHFEEAAQFFLHYAGKVTQIDDDAHGDAMWKAAENFDRAMAWPEAIRVYSDFIQNRIRDDRLLSAKLNLGKALLADGRHEASVSRLSGLIQQHANSPVAVDAYVPLGRAYRFLRQFDDSERVLKHVVEDHPTVLPESETYREALMELGELYFRRALEDPVYFSSAISTLKEAVDRYGMTRAGPNLRYMLADSYRQSIMAIDLELEGQPSPRAQVRFREERDSRLMMARELYSQVKTELEDRPYDQLSNLEKLYHRNSYFYEADCLYELGGLTNLESAIDLYGRAASRFADHPASLVAQVQIVNAYCEMGQLENAATAHRKALYLLERLPEEAFEDRSIPMTRKHWEDWLRWSAELGTLADDAQASATP